MKFKTVSVIALAIALTPAAFAAEVYSWKEGGHTAYSDTPRGLRMDYANKLNIRTQTVRPSTDIRHKMPESLAEQQMELSQKVAAENRKIEENNAKLAAEAAKMKKENCEQARSNRKLAEGARNRDQLLPKYDADIQRYCND